MDSKWKCPTDIGGHHCFCDMVRCCGCRMRKDEYDLYANYTPTTITCDDDGSMENVDL